MTQKLSEADMVAWELDLLRREKAVREQEATLLDAATHQSLLLVLFRKTREKNWLKAADLNEIENATRMHSTGDYRPTEQLRGIVRRTQLELEEKRNRPR